MGNNKNITNLSQETEVATPQKTCSHVGRGALLAKPAGLEKLPDLFQTNHTQNIKFQPETIGTLFQHSFPKRCGQMLKTSSNRFNNFRFGLPFWRLLLGGFPPWRVVFATRCSEPMEEVQPGRMLASPGAPLVRLSSHDG